MQYKSFMEALKGKQHKIDKNKNGKIDAHDFELLRKEEKEESNESFEFNRAAIAKQRLQNLRHSGRRVRGASVANLMRAAGIREEEMDDEDLDQLDEVLGKDATASDWIHDFVHSTNPKFEGKTKKERIKMALGAYYDQARDKQQMEAVQKADIPAYLRKQQGQTPLKLSDLKRKDTISDKENLAKLRNEDVKEPTGDLKDACWKGYTAVGMKMKNGKKVPNCVPVKEETDTSEKHSMAENQLHFIKYAAEEILEYIKMGGQIEEWYQNKLSKVQSEVESLHSYVEGESRRQGMKEEVDGTGPVKVKVQADKEAHEEKWESAKKKPVKEEYDEDGNVTYSKMSYKDFTESLVEARAQYMVKATHKATGRVKVSNYVADKDESEYSVRSRAEREHKPMGYSIDSIRRKDIEAHGEGDEEETTSSTTQKRGRGRPAGSKSGARGPRIK